MNGGLLAMEPLARRFSDGRISSQDLHGPKPQRFDVELSDLEFAEEDLVEVFGSGAP